MTDQDVVDENLALLRSLWERLVSNSCTPASELGISGNAAVVLARMDEFQMKRAADVHAPLFGFDCSPETLRRALEEQAAEKGALVTDQVMNRQLFLSNRWRACESSFVSAQMLFGINRDIYTHLRRASFGALLNAAKSNAQLFRLTVRPQYLVHAGSRFDLHTAHRTAMAICNAHR